MKTQVLRSIASIAMFICMSKMLFAQNGQINGKVIDLHHSETIIGGTVQLQELGKYATTNLDGLFEFKNIQDGTYTLRISNVGFTSQTLEVLVQGQKHVFLEISLVPESNQIEAVIITSQGNKRSESGLIAERKNAVLVIQKIGAQELDRKGVSNVSEGLSKVAGVSMVGNNAMFVRGLGDRYNNATLNGLPIPSTNPDLKVIPLDIFPTSIVENIAIVKSYSSQFYGDFSGGTVDVVTRSYPSSQFFKVDFTTGYNSISTGNHFQQSPNANRGLFGFDKSKRALPDQVVNSSVYNSYDNGNRDPFRVNWSPQTAVAPLNRGISVATGNRFDFEGGQRLGFLLSVTHKGGYTTEDGIAAIYNAQQAPKYHYETESFSFKTNTSGLASVSYGPNAHSNYTFTALAVNQSDDEISNNLGEHSDLGALFGQRNTLTQNTLLAGQISSNVDFNEERKLKWALGYTKTIGSTPDRTQNTFQAGANNQFTFLTNSISDNHRFFAKLNDQEASGKVEMDFTGAEESALMKSFQLGLDGRYKDRGFDSRQFDADIRITEAVNPEDIGSVLTDENLGDGSKKGQWYYQEGYYGPNNYSANLAIVAPYANFNFNWNERWTLVAGLRIEASVQNTDYKKGSDASDLPFRRNTLNGVDFLPGATLKYLLTERSNILLAASRTLSRPLFTEVAPFRYNNAAATAERQGNPGLVNTTNYNLDLKYEVYPQRGELMAVSVFGKYLKDPIEMMQVATADALFSFINTDQAVLAGIELELNRNLGSLLQSESATLRKMSVGFNGSLLYSTITLTQSRIEQNRALGVPVAPTNRKRPLYGASPYLINLDYSYQANWGKQANTTFTLAYNVFGKRLFIAGSERAGDIYELPVNTLDANINSMLTKNIGLDLSFANLLNPAVLFEQEFSANNLEFSRFKRGVSIGASLSYKF